MALKLPLLILSIFALTKCSESSTVQPRILGGQPVEDWEPYKYMAFLTTYDPDNGQQRGFCGGTVLDKEHILTAAHCFFPPGVHKPATYAQVAMGTKYDMYLQKPGLVHTHGDAIMHPKYNRRGLKNDLAIVKIPALDFDKYKQIGRTDFALETDVPIADMCFILGWGANGTAEVTEILNKADMPILTTDICKSNSARFDETTTYCAGPQPSAEENGSPNSCKGDSGGPLMCRAGSSIGPIKQFGVISYSKGVCNPGMFHPTFFPKIPYYSKWIQSVLKRNK